MYISLDKYLKTVTEHSNLVPILREAILKDEKLKQYVVPCINVDTIEKLNLVLKGTSESTTSLVPKEYFNNSSFDKEEKINGTEEIIINGIAFDSWETVLNKAKEILKTYEVGSILEGENFNFVKDLMVQKLILPYTLQQNGGIKSIQVKKKPSNTFGNFYAIFGNGSEKSISLKPYVHNGKNSV